MMSLASKLTKIADLKDKIVDYNRLLAGWESRQFYNHDGDIVIINRQDIRNMEIELEVLKDEINI